MVLTSGQSLKHTLTRASASEYSGKVCILQILFCFNKGREKGTAILATLKCLHKLFRKLVPLNKW